MFFSGLGRVPRVNFLTISRQAQFFMKPCTEVRKCSIRVTEEYIFYEILHVDYMHRARALASLFVCLVVRLWTASLRFVQKNNKGKNFILNPLVLVLVFSGDSPAATGKTPA